MTAIILVTDNMAKRTVGVYSDIVKAKKAIEEGIAEYAEIGFNINESNFSYQIITINSPILLVC